MPYSIGWVCSLYSLNRQPGPRCSPKNSGQPTFPEDNPLERRGSQANCPAGRSIRPQTCSCREHDNRANFTKDPHSENPQNKILSEVSTNGALFGEVCWPKRIYSNFRSTV